MARWDDGYVTDTVYTSQFHRETTPGWLAAAALLLGQRPPSLSGAFRYADLGCGNGLTALVVAATHPQAEIWGFDFNPAHIEFATRLADRAGLRNATFVEASFADLAGGQSHLPPCDFMIAHGILSWISPDNQQHLIDTVGSCLRPGGLAYVSYNVATGAANLLPLRTLMRILAEAAADRTDQIAAGILDQLHRIRQAGALFFQSNPTLEPRLESMRKQDPRYLAHEFLNRDWRPLMFADVADAMAEAKCRFIGSATLCENIPATSVPPEMVALLGESPDPRLRETVRDIGAAQSFRRDIYRRGIAPMPAGEQQEAIGALRFGWTGQAIREPLSFSTAIGAVTGNPEVYHPLLQRLQAGPVTLPQLAAAVGQPLPDMMQGLTLLTWGGYAHPLLPDHVAQAAIPGTHALNQAIAALNSDGGELSVLATPVLGTALSCGLLETLVAGALLDGVPAALPALAEAALRTLARTGRHMQRDAQPLTEPAAALAAASEAVGSLLQSRGELWRSLQMVPH
jgi:SAM-dependent methyltransferase